MLIGPYLFSCVLLVCPPADLSQRQKEHALTGTTINGGTTVGAQGATVQGSKAVGPIKPIGPTVGMRGKSMGEQELEHMDRQRLEARQDDPTIYRRLLGDRIKSKRACEASG